jgi:hypothetical protein
VLHSLMATVALRVSLPLALIFCPPSTNVAHKGRKPDSFCILTFPTIFLVTVWPAKDNHTLNFCHGKAIALRSINLSLTKGKIQHLSHNMSVLQESLEVHVSGSTFNAVGGNQINHTHIYSGKFCLSGRNCSPSHFGVGNAHGVQFHDLKYIPL